MDDRQTRLLVVLAAAVLAIGLVYWLAPRGRDPAWDASATVTVWALEPETVSALTIEQPGKEPMIARKSDEGWKLASPVEGLADAARIEAALSTLASLDKAIPVTDTPPEELGLGDPPRAHVTLVRGGGQELSLDLGDAAPVGWQTYVRTPDGEIAVVPVLFDKDVMTDPWSFRDAGVFRFPPGEVARAELHSPHGTLVVSRDDADLWWLEGYGRADLSAIDNLFLSLLELRLDQFLDGAIQGSISEPEYRIVVGLRDGTTLEARIGDELPYGRLVLASTGAVGTILTERLALLDQGPTDLADRFAFPVRGSRVDRVQISLEGHQVDFEGGEGRWHAAGRSPADGLALFEALRRVTVDVGAEAPEALAEVVGRVRIHEGDARVRTIEIGPARGGVRFVRDLAGGPVQVVDEAAIQTVLERLSTGG